MMKSNNLGILVLKIVSNLKLKKVSKKYALVQTAQNFAFLSLTGIFSISKKLFFLNFYLSILLELGLSLAHFLLPTYFKSI